MRPLLALAALAAFSAHAEPPAGIDAGHLQRASALAGDYRQCLQDTLGERYINVGNGDALQLAAEVEKSCEPKLLPVQNYLGAQGYADSVVAQALVDIKAKADGAAIAYVHRLPRYRF